MVPKNQNEFHTKTKNNNVFSILKLLPKNKSVWKKNWKKSPIRQLWLTDCDNNAILTSVLQYSTLLYKGGILHGEDMPKSEFISAKI